MRFLSARVGCFFVIFLSLVLFGCRKNNIIPERYTFFSCYSFGVLEYSKKYPKGRLVYEIDKDGELIITAISYDSKNQIVAIALSSNVPTRGTAIIRIFEYENFALISETATGKDRINGMDFNEMGQIAFSTSDLDHNYPGELCLFSQKSNDQKTLAKGLNFYKPSWGEESNKIFFSFHSAKKWDVAFLDLNDNGIIKELANGSSITVSDKESMAYLADGKIYFSQKQDSGFRVLDLPEKYTKPSFTDSIKFVKGANELVLQQYRKATNYDILISSPPYTKANILLTNIGMIDFDIAVSD